MDKAFVEKYAKPVGLAGLAGVAGILTYKLLTRRKSRPVVKPNDVYDYIVVGAGSSGAVLAARLSEDPGVSVLLVEAGGEETGNYLFKIPLAAMMLQGSDSDWQYYTVPQEGTNMTTKKGDNRHYWPRGKVLGGCSMYNNMQYVRGNRLDYDEWAQNGCTGWAYDDVLPYFIKSEDVLLSDLKNSKYHGTGGPLGVTREAGELVKYFCAAGEELGYEGDHDYNGERQEGFCASQVTVRGGQRASTAREFLRPAMSRPNLHVLVQAHVTKVLIENKTAIGIAYSKHGRDSSIRARREVVLSAGAVGSPHILLLSGIGPRQHLDAFNIPVVADLPVGENLQDHLFADLISDANIRDGITKAKVTSVWNVLKYWLFGKGLLASTGLTGSAFVSTPINKKKYPDLQFHLIPACGDLYDFKTDQEALKDSVKQSEDGMILEHILLHPKSVGTIRLASKNPFDHPLIDPRYLSEKEDVETFVEGFKIGQKLLETNAFKKAGVSLERLRRSSFGKDVPFLSDEFYDRLVRHTARTVYHPTSTCKMGGAGDSRAVVDPELRVRGVANLRVADASIMPNIVSGNTNAPCIMIGEKAADLLLAKDTVAHIRARIQTPQ